MGLSKQCSGLRVVIVISLRKTSSESEHRLWRYRTSKKKSHWNFGTSGFRKPILDSSGHKKSPILAWAGLENWNFSTHFAALPVFTTVLRKNRCVFDFRMKKYISLNEIFRFFEDLPQFYVETKFFLKSRKTSKGEISRTNVPISMIFLKNCY